MPPWESPRRGFHAEGLEGTLDSRKEGSTLSRDVLSCSSAGVTEPKIYQLWS
ncbi:hypothetical protein OIU76_028054 [Salix suchowensis]|nr:hypothetical protein OIU76_028054 [Salix suchowensis]KAJ6371095.1 hypothetical protein OIU77_001577 [Salix suchowensis]KAJ6752916.1 hypothetical protein OIU74_027704 [Salix koriyanagi]